MEQFDPQAEIDRYIAQLSCELCGRHTDIVGEFTEQWFCRISRKGGYTSKHWRKWRACAYCFSHGELLYSWLSTTIKSAVINLDFMSQLIPLQPLPTPTGNVFYLDRINELNPCGETRMDYREATTSKYQLLPEIVDYAQEVERIEHVRQTARASARALVTALQGVNMQAPDIRPSVVNA